jgi:hypothetical protein
MTSGRERVQRCLRFEQPDRAPRDIWLSPAVSLLRAEEAQTILKEYPLDFTRVSASDITSKRSLQPFQTVGEFTDEWGSVWRNGEVGMMGEVVKPALDDWSKLTDYQPPWELLKEKDFNYINRHCESTDNFVLTTVTAKPFERLQWIRGTENLLIDIAYDTQQWRQLLEMVHDFYLQEITGWCQSYVDGVFFSDDWGHQRGLLTSPNVFREFFKPIYEQYCNIIHKVGKFVFFHSDGCIEQLYPDFTEIGIDAINSQLFTMDIEELARKHKGQITFWGEVDRQHVLAFGTEKEIRQAVYRLRRAFDDGNGGVISQFVWGKGNPTSTIRCVLDTWQESMSDTESRFG